MHSKEVSAERKFTDGQEYFKKTLSSRRRGDMQTFSKVLKWRSCLSQQ